MAVSDQDSRGVPMPRAVLLGGLDEALDLPVGEIFTAALANCYIYAVEPPREAASFPWKQPSGLFRRVTDLDGCSSPAPPDLAGGSAGKS